ncbi:hypothetical protein BSG8_24230 [Bacillus subtilis subsp. natto]|nr:hypothetical protein BsLM_2430 [Bacillus sp. LM 4-2]BAI85993.1 hypothetical protein BSNT_08913 [Bacillus subtilis subsp. natto BEST195]BDB93671.1 hypothetical protein BSG8_24230 [Bacillus subtilis subsp. natto]BEH06486.1 hypothetical protein BSNN_25190 [Bacillus subtilis subsp. natto]GAK78321.1 hypothetical protein BSMD_002170 [Bacillus subtilis Miyagi-4]
MRIVEKEGAVIKQGKRDFVRRYMLKNPFFLARKRLSTECTPVIIIFPINKKADMVTMPARFHFHYAVFAF